MGVIGDNEFRVGTAIAAVSAGMSLARTKHSEMSEHHILCEIRLVAS